jgi:hypothetical protein
MSNHQQSNKTKKIFEGLEFGDLRHMVSEVFSVDQFKSKMGEDRDTVVIAFRVKDKHPAIDLMEFVEKGYPFILDSDMSAGEESDGKYQVFVEIERTAQLPGQMRELMSGVSQLTDNYNWRFKYQHSTGQIPFSEEKILEHVPLSGNDYENKILEIKNNNVNKFFSEGALDGVSVEADGTMTFMKPFFGNLKMKLVTMGRYDDVKTTVPGALSLDENGQSQVLFLQKYLGNYDIDKIGDKFLIRNGNKGMVVQKDTW